MHALLISLTLLAVEPMNSDLDLRDSKGKVLVSAEEILSYEWSSHTLIVKKGVADRLADRLILQDQKLASPFTVALGGKTIYNGKLTTRFSSYSQNSVVIVVDHRRDKKAKTDRIQLEIGYPSEEYFKGEDPRYDPRVKKSLIKAGKLKKEPA